MIQIENLHKSFGRVDAVKGISCSVAKGEVVGLLGPNGAGKTTTMRLITGYLAPDQGNIVVDGISVLTDSEKTRASIGYLPENAPLYHDMEVIEFLEYVASLRQVSDTCRGDRVREVVSLCGLKTVVGRLIGQLSRGFKQRVGLAQAMIHKPPILILDEPTTGLDPHQIQEIRALIKEVGRERTVILSRHIMQEVEAVCDRALIISRGVLAGEGTLEELTRKKKGGSRYVVRIRGPREEITRSLPDLAGLSVEEWHNGTIALRSPDGGDRGEEIFQWVVRHQWALQELRREESSLEEVFLELTK